MNTEETKSVVYTGLWEQVH